MSTKSEELRNPQSCLNKARSDEMLFVLKSSDPLFAQTVRLWCAMAAGVHSEAKIMDAYHCADYGEKQRADQAEPVPEGAIAGGITAAKFNKVAQSAIAAYEERIKNMRGGVHILGNGPRDPHDPSYDPQN